MAVYYIKFPQGNPVKFVRGTNVQDLFWNQKVPFFETQDVDYTQKFQTSDYIQFQMIFRPDILATPNLAVELRSVDDNATYGIFQPTGVAWIYSSNEMAVTFRLNLYNPTIPDGEYYVYIYAPYVSGANFDLYYSERLDIRTTHEGTMLLEYTNDGHDFDMFFFKDFACVNPLWFQLRVEGGFRSDGFQPSSVDSAFLDQTHNATLLSSVPFDVQKLTFGDNTGIPDWMATRCNRILSCTDFKKDGVSYTKVDGAKLERMDLAQNHPRFSWKIDLIRSDNSYVEAHAIAGKVVTGGIGTMVIEESFIIASNVNTGAMAQTINNGMSKPGVFPVPALVGGVEEKVPHNLGMPFYISQVQDAVTGNVDAAKFEYCKPDPANPTTHFVVKSVVDIPAGTYKLAIVGFYEY